MKSKFILCLFILSNALNFAYGQKLLFSVEPEKTDVQVKENFKVFLRLMNPPGGEANPMPTTQTIHVMSCSWYDQLNLQGPAGSSCVTWACRKNTENAVKLLPGDVWTNELEMCLTEPLDQKKFSFQLGFKPIGSTNTFWSKKVEMKITLSEHPATK